MSNTNFTFPLETKGNKYVIETDKGTFLCKSSFDADAGTDQSFIDVFDEDGKHITEICLSTDFDDMDEVLDLIKAIESDDDIL